MGHEQNQVGLARTDMAACRIDGTLVGIEVLKGCELSISHYYRREKGLLNTLFTVNYNTVCQYCEILGFIFVLHPQSLLPIPVVLNFVRLPPFFFATLMNVCILPFEAFLPNPCS